LNASGATSVPVTALGITSIRRAGRAARTYPGWARASLGRADTQTGRSSPSSSARFRRRAETVGLFLCLADGVVTTADPLDYDLGGRWTLADVQPVTMTG